MIVKIALFTKDEMVVYLLDKEYEADDIPLTYTHHNLSRGMPKGFSEIPPRIFITGNKIFY